MTASLASLAVPFESGAIVASGTLRTEYFPVVSDWSTSTDTPEISVKSGVLTRSRLATQLSELLETDADILAKLFRLEEKRLTPLFQKLTAAVAAFGDDVPCVYVQIKNKVHTFDFLVDSAHSGANGDAFVSEVTSGHSFLLLLSSKFPILKTQSCLEEVENACIARFENKPAPALTCCVDDAVEVTVIHNWSNVLWERTSIDFVVENLFDRLNSLPEAVVRFGLQSIAVHKPSSHTPTHKLADILAGLQVSPKLEAALLRISAWMERNGVNETGLANCSVAEIEKMLNNGCPTLEAVQSMVEWGRHALQQPVDPAVERVLTRLEAELVQNCCYSVLHRRLIARFSNLSDLDYPSKPSKWPKLTLVVREDANPDLLAILTFPAFQRLLWVQFEHAPEPLVLRCNSEWRGLGFVQHEPIIPHASYNEEKKFLRLCPDTKHGLQRFWLCQECREFLTFSRENSSVICKCGESLRTELKFKCCHREHKNFVLPIGKSTKTFSKEMPNKNVPEKKSSYSHTPTQNANYASSSINNATSNSAVISTSLSVTLNQYNANPPTQTPTYASVASRKKEEVSMASSNHTIDVPNVSPLQRKPDTHIMNILVLGPRGGGKSTFINAIDSYLIHDSFVGARSSDRNPPIPFKCTLNNGNSQHKTKSNYGKKQNRDGIDANEQCFTSICSTTTVCSCFEVATENSQIRLIDTPGLEAKNYREILKKIKAFVVEKFDYIDYIHAVVFVVDGTVQSEHLWLDSVLSALPIELLSQSVFVSTKTQKPSHKQSLRRIYGKYEFLRFNERNFVMDNNACCIAWAYQNGINAAVSRNCEEMWTQSSATVKNLLRVVQSLPPFTTAKLFFFDGLTSLIDLFYKSKLDWYNKELEKFKIYLCNAFAIPPAQLPQPGFKKKSVSEEQLFDTLKSLSKKCDKHYVEIMDLLSFKSTFISPETDVSWVQKLATNALDSLKKLI